jgi:hypothetical protein
LAFCQKKFLSPLAGCLLFFLLFSYGLSFVAQAPPWTCIFMFFKQQDYRK